MKTYDQRQTTILIGKIRREIKVKRKVEELYSLLSEKVEKIRGANEEEVEKINQELLLLGEKIEEAQTELTDKIDEVIADKTKDETLINLIKEAKSETNNQIVSLNNALNDFKNKSLSKEQIDKVVKLNISEIPEHAPYDDTELKEKIEDVRTSIPLIPKQKETDLSGYVTKTELVKSTEKRDNVWKDQLLKGTRRVGSGAWGGSEKPFYTKTQVDSLITGENIWDTASDAIYPTLMDYKVGIGTRTPVGQLSIASTTSGSYPFVITSSNSIQSVYIYEGTDYNPYYIMKDRDDIGRVLLHTDGDSYIEGNVGIGYNSPVSKLHVGNSTNYALFSTTGDLTFEGTGGLAFGSCGGNHIALTIADANAVQNTWYNCSDSTITDGELHLVTHNGGGLLTVEREGKYLATYSLCFEDDAANDHVEVGFELDGGSSAETLGQSHLENKFASEQEHVGSSTVLDLAAGSTIELTIRHIDAGTPDITVHNINLNLIQIGGR